jgi:hypothetical protein
MAISHRKPTMLSRQRCLLLLCTLVLAMEANSSCRNECSSMPVLGWVERAIVMPLGATVKMKLDSGALTSSMDAREIEVFRRDGKRWVKFVLHLEDNATGEDVYRTLDLPLKRMVRLRGAGGEDLRPAVDIPICIGNKVYTEEFTLRDRDDMLYPVLLGRNTISHLGLLDVTRTYLNTPDCPVPELKGAK